jgi:hypothetical protein
LALAEVNEHYAEKALNSIKALNNLENKNEKTLTLAKAKLYENEEYITLLSAQSKAYAEKKLIDSLYKSAEGRSFVVSRELSRRLSRNDKDR